MGSRHPLPLGEGRGEGSFSRLLRKKQRPAGRHRRQPQIPRQAKGLVHGVSRRQLHKQPLLRFPLQSREQFGIVADHHDPAPVLVQGRNEIEPLAAVQIRDEPRDVRVAVLVLRQQHRAVLCRNRLRPDDRRDPGIPRRSQKAWNPVKAVAVSERESAEAEFARLGAKRLRRVDAPVRRKRGVNMQVDEHI